LTVQINLLLFFNSITQWNAFYKKYYLKALNQLQGLVVATRHDAVIMCAKCKCMTWRWILVRFKSQEASLLFWYLCTLRPPLLRPPFCRNSDIVFPTLSVSRDFIFHLWFIRYEITLQING